MLQNDYLLAKIGADTAENEPAAARWPAAGGGAMAAVPDASPGFAAAPSPATSRSSARAVASERASRCSPASVKRGLTEPLGRLGSCQFLANFRQNFARSRLYRRRSLQANTRFAAFFKIYQIISDYLTENFEIWQIFADFATFANFLLNFHRNC